MAAGRCGLMLMLLIGLAPETVWAVDYVVLRDGRTVQGAILRLDSMSITMTDWEYRTLLQPPLQVYTKDEIRSIWYAQPEQVVRQRILFRPRPKQIELAGGLAFQTTAGTDYDRESIGQVSVICGMSAARWFGFELDAIYTGPSGSSGFQRGFQTLANLAVYPVTWRGIVPFAVAGGGAAIDVPFDRLVLTRSDDVGNVADIGVGAKAGANGIGARFEVRHHFYSWSVIRPVDPSDWLGPMHRVRVEADMTDIRLSLFAYF
ncbi:hypothetical protein HZB60_02025 [candidate division KSB1 bacterium]|nr:hypothetical protein [candidate division KSB1 bacterium]